LIALYHRSRDRNEYFHVRDIRVGSEPTGWGDWAKLRYWKLIEEMPKDDSDETRKTSGRWRITEKGITFVERSSFVQKYCLIRLHEHIGFEGDLIDIVDALGDRFSYEELMRR